MEKCPAKEDKCLNLNYIILLKNCAAAVWSDDDSVWNKTELIVADLKIEFFKSFFLKKDGEEKLC